jgi:hypothetical protein
MPSRGHYLVRGVLLGAIGLLGGLALGELGTRFDRHWMPPVQMVRGYGLHSVDGVPLWEESTDRYNRGCVERHPERTRILFFGSSITYGVSLNADEVFTTALEERLNQLWPTPGFCVLNFAQPGFQFEQKYAVARVEVPRYQPALIMWEDWVEWQNYHMIGETAYGIGDLVVRPDGFIGLAGVPDPLNRFLFLHSRLYEYVALRFGERRVPVLPEVPLFVNTQLIKVVRLAESVGARLVLYLAPPLDRPFAETAASLPDWHGMLVDFAQAHGIPVYPLERELVDQDYLALRLDPCCHFNAAGHRALVPVMERIVRGQLDHRSY